MAHRRLTELRFAIVDVPEGSGCKALLRLQVLLCIDNHPVNRRLQGNMARLDHAKGAPTRSRERTATDFLERYIDSMQAAALSRPF